MSEANCLPSGQLHKLGSHPGLDEADESFLMDFFFSVIILKRAVVYQPLSLVFCFPLKAGPTLLGLSGWLLAKAVCTGLWMRSVSKLSPSAVQSWFVEDFTGTNQQILEAVMALWLV